MEPTVTVTAEAGAAARSGRATVAETVNKAVLSRLFMAGASKKIETMGIEVGEAVDAAYRLSLGYIMNR
jgi:hypothetical protein